MKKRGESILDSLTSVFFSAIGVKIFELVAGLSFNHCKPAFEEGEDCVGLFIFNCVDPRIACS